MVIVKNDTVQYVLLFRLGAVVEGIVDQWILEIVLLSTEIKCKIK